ncbi:DUF1294 domain-containing protein [Neobacillus thermocopriae]|uniref:DUF1294 domain-containing protein n=1 Tax=Neobacillus thermocopriae TaxID=1215031 RepID=A0A6B3TRT3_9BACI|nr:DUF1294 domain-containing protein [Neobacillus thermocopriae]MED3622696.1 DUF1294 domain-containing protein [Neobacillus thermocopriae]MED3714132.1 DUF1294 domain-containing protein [Neobacillus thermocopriae]NEX78417.1 DUF1294 domain-containing protein [Neobacillus thermocopriae]
MYTISIVFFIMTVTGFGLMGMDKRKAKKHQYRIPEMTLWLVALLGGAVGTYFGMQCFRHKTKHLSFRIGFPILAIIDIILFIKIVGVF